MLPAGEMWSVVMESPRNASARASLMGSAGAGPASEAARRVAGQLGEGQVQRYEGETFDGRPIVTTRSTQLHATVATLRVHVHGTKWLWSVDATPEVHKTFDFHF